MDFKLGNLKLNATGFPLFDNHMALMQLAPIRRQAPIETLFTWNCATQRGSPAQPLSPFLAKCFLNFHLPDPPGQRPGTAARQMFDRWKTAGGFKTDKQFVDAFAAVIPDIPFPIDEAKLINPFKPNYKFKVTGFAAYDHFIVRANGGLPGDYALLSIPWHVYLQTGFLGVCNNAEDPGISRLLETDGGTPALNQLQKDLVTAYRADLDEAIRRMREDRPLETPPGGN